MEPRITLCCIPATVVIQATGDTSFLAFPNSPPPPFRPPPFPRQEATLRPPSSSSSIPIPPRHDHRPVSTRPVGSASPSFGEGVSGSCSRSGGWSRDDNAGLSGEAELLGPPRCPVARRSRRHPRLRCRLHRRAPPRRRRLPPEV